MLNLVLEIRLQKLLRGVLLGRFSLFWDTSPGKLIFPLGLKPPYPALTLLTQKQPGIAVPHSVYNRLVLF